MVDLNVLLFMLMAFPILVLLLIVKQKTTKKSTYPPGPKGLPFFGNLLQFELFDGANLFMAFHKLSRKHGPIFYLQLGAKPVVIINSSKLAKEIMKTKDHEFCGRPPFYSSQKFTYKQLDMAFATYGEYWRQTKKISIVHFLSQKCVSKFSSIRKYEVTQLVKKIEEHASCSKVTNLHELLTCLTSAIVCRTALGRRYEEEKIEKSMFHDMLKETQALIVSTFYSDYVPIIGGLIDRYSGLMGRLERMFKVWDEFLENAINEHLDPQRKKLTDEEDLIDAFLQFKNDSSFTITPSHIKPLMLNIIMAGIDPSAAVVVWAMTALIQNPRAMKKVQEEIRKVYGGKEFIEEDDIQNLAYLKAVIKETMRLFPPLPLLLPREALKKCSIEGYEIPKKTTVYVNAWAVHRDPEAWKDPYEFQPERFLDSTIDFGGNDFGFIPFGSGRRICPGIQMGIVISELVLANILCSYDWEMPPGLKSEDIDTHMLPGYLQHKKSPLCLVSKIPV